MKNSLAFALVFLATYSVQAQRDSLIEHYCAMITIDELREHLTILASDEYLGRDTGKEGQKMAAAYLKQQFQQAGIPPVPAPDPKVITEGYFQPYALVEERPGGIQLEVGNRTLGLQQGLLYFSEKLEQDLLLEQLEWWNGSSTIAPEKTVAPIVLTKDDGSREISDLMGWLKRRASEVGERGGNVLLVATPRMGAIMDLVGHHAGSTRVRLATPEVVSTKVVGTQMILVADEFMDAMLVSTKWKKLQRKSSGFQVEVKGKLLVRSNTQDLIAENVLAYIEGTDKRDELVVLTAHYDHIGVENGVVYNGADDDGTGTVAMIEIAEAFATAKAEGHGPRRSILVMPVSGEEKGLLGSRYYSEHPVFPLEQTVADLNIDMIGRTDSAHTGKLPYVYIIGSDRLSQDLHDVNEASNSEVGLELDYTFNAVDDPNRFYFRSDHYNFARKGVPSIFYFSGVHEDYHQPGDDVEKIQFDLLQQRTQLVFRTAWNIANREERLRLSATDGP